MDLEKFKIKFDIKNPSFIGLLIGLTIFIVILVAYYYIFFSGLRMELKQKVQTLDAAKAKYNMYVNDIKSYPALKEKEALLNKEFSVLILELPLKKDIPGLLMKISNEERILGLNLKMFKPGKSVPRNFYEEVPFSMNISGPFFDVYKFFYKVAEMKRIVYIHDVSISSKTSSTGKAGKVSVTFQGTTFWFRGSLPPKTQKPTGGTK